MDLSKITAYAILILIGYLIVKRARKKTERVAAAGRHRDHVISAAEAGNAVAMYKLSRSYRSGDIVRKDQGKANQLLEASAEKGWYPAIQDLCEYIREKREGYTGSYMNGRGEWIRSEYGKKIKDLLKRKFTVLWEDPDRREEALACLAAGYDSILEHNETISMLKKAGVEVPDWCSRISDYSEELEEKRWQMYARYCLYPDTQKFEDDLKEVQAWEEAIREKKREAEAREYERMSHTPIEVFEFKLCRNISSPREDELMTSYIVPAGYVFDVIDYPDLVPLFSCWTPGLEGAFEYRSEKLDSRYKPQGPRVNVFDLYTYISGKIQEMGYRGVKRYGVQYAPGKVVVLAYDTIKGFQCFVGIHVSDVAGTRTIEIHPDYLKGNGIYSEIKEYSSARNPVVLIHTQNLYEDSSWIQCRRVETGWGSVPDDFKQRSSTMKYLGEDGFAASVIDLVQTSVHPYMLLIHVCKGTLRCGDNVYGTRPSAPASEDRKYRNISQYTWDFGHRTVEDIIVDGRSVQSVSRGQSAYIYLKDMEQKADDLIRADKYNAENGRLDISDPGSSGIGMLRMHMLLKS